MSKVRHPGAKSWRNQYLTDRVDPRHVAKLRLWAMESEDCGRSGTCELGAAGERCEGSGGKPLAENATAALSFVAMSEFRSPRVMMMPPPRDGRLRRTSLEAVCCSSDVLSSRNGHRQ